MCFMFELFVTHIIYIMDKSRNTKMTTLDRYEKTLHSTTILLLINLNSGYS